MQLQQFSPSCGNEGKKYHSYVAYGTFEQLAQKQINIYRLFSDLLLQRQPSLALLSNGISPSPHIFPTQTFFIWKMKTLHWSIYVFRTRYRYAFALYVLLQYFPHSQVMTMANDDRVGDSLKKNYFFKLKKVKFL